MTTPAEKDAMALAVFPREAAGCDCESCTAIREARAHLAARVAEQAEEIRALKAEVKGLSQSLTDAIDQHEDAKVDAKFIREAYFKAEAELAAVIDKAVQEAVNRAFAAVEPIPHEYQEHWIARVRDHARASLLDAARGAG